MGIYKYNGTVVGIVRKMLRMSYADFADRLGLSVARCQAIEQGREFIERSASESTVAVYDSLHKQATATPERREVFARMCKAAELDLMGDN